MSSWDLRVTVFDETTGIRSLKRIFTYEIQLRMVVVQPVRTLRVLTAKNPVICQQVLVIFIKLLDDVMHERLLTSDKLGLLLLCGPYVELFELLNDRPSSSCTPW